MGRSNHVVVIFSHSVCITYLSVMLHAWQNYLQISFQEGWMLSVTWNAYYKLVIVSFVLFYTLIEGRQFYAFDQLW